MIVIVWAGWKGRAGQLWAWIYTRPWLTAGTVFLGQKIGRCASPPVQEAGCGACASACTRRCLEHTSPHIYIPGPGMRRHNDSFHDVHRCNGSGSAKGPAYIPDIALPLSSSLYLLELMFYLATDCNLATCTTTGQVDFLPTTISREYSSLKVFWEVCGSLMMVFWTEKVIITYWFCLYIYIAVLCIILG